jgi:hypothetical protein
VVEKGLGRKRARWKPISLLFKEEKAMEAVLDFLGHTGVSKLRREEVPGDEGADESDEE